MGALLESGDIQLVYEDGLYKKGLVISGFKPAGGFGSSPSPLEAKIRSTAPPAPCRLQLLGDGWAQLDFEQAVRAPAPGQLAVLYSSGLVAGSGFIERSL